MKVCILAAGKGTRNQSVKGLHKALLPLENKPAISYILDKVPHSTEVVIAVGYKSNQIKTYIKEVYPDLSVVYVDVDNYEGENSGPGYSLLSCQKHLQEPFVFTAVDTIIKENYPYIECTYNWIGVSQINPEESEKYCLVRSDDNITLSELYYGDGSSAYIGMAGLYDYQQFWENLSNPTLINNEHQVINGFVDMQLQLVNLDWHDIGNNDSYNKAKKTFCNDIVAAKNNEALFVHNSKVIKFFDDTNRIKLRDERTKYLPTPDIKLINENMYSYDYVNGTTLSKIYDEKVFENFVGFLQNNLYNNTGNKDKEFTQNCQLMYKEKTITRLKPLFGTELDKIKYINGIETKPVEVLLSEIDWESIYEHATPSHFHGDLQPENVLYSHQNQQFTLIDWRESFGSSLEFGDIYYDLSKLYHGLLINGQTILEGHYDSNVQDKSSYVQFLIKNNLLSLKETLKQFCKDNKYNWSNVKLLGVLHYLNICNLYNGFHGDKYKQFLFLYGKLLLTKRKYNNERPY